MSKKYVFTKDTIVHEGVVLHRIKAIRDIGTMAEKGTLGGYIEKESNLSQEDDCWVDRDSKVLGNVQIQNYVRIYNSTIHGSICIKDGTLIMNSVINGDGTIDGSGCIEQSNIAGCFTIKNSNINHVTCSAKCVIIIHSNIDNSSLSYSTINNSKIEYSNVGENVDIIDSIIYNTDINKNVSLNNVNIENETPINSNSDVLVFKNNWSSLRFFTYYVPSKKWFVGCFKGTGKELIEKAYKDSELSGKMYEKYVKFAENELTIHLQ